MKFRAKHRIGRPRANKGAIPLSKLRTAEAVRTVVAHPRRLVELLGLLEDPDRVTRSRAAAAIAGLAMSHPGRLIGSLQRVQEALGDDSAHVRWHLACALGTMVVRFPRQAAGAVPDLAACLDDQNRMVRHFTVRAFLRLSRSTPGLVEQAFASANREVPAGLARIIASRARRPDRSGIR